MVIVLCQRVYEVMNPQGEDDALPMPRPPSINPDNVDPPDNPPAVPQDLTSENWSLLHIRPVTLFVRPRTGPTDKDDPSATTNLVLLDMRKSGNDFRVQISTGQGRARWYKEGDRFESYEIDVIDPDNRTCTVYSEEDNEKITLTSIK
jgi:hypothetical protein